MEFVRCQIAKSSGGYASGGTPLVSNRDERLARRTPKLRPGEVVEVCKQHWLASRAYAKTIDLVDKPITRPYYFANDSDVSYYAYSAKPLKSDVLQRGLDYSRERFEKVYGPPREKVKRKVVNRRTPDGAGVITGDDSHDDIAST